jgi:hypothetical protein
MKSSTTATHITQRIIYIFVYALVIFQPLTTRAEEPKQIQIPQDPIATNPDTFTDIAQRVTNIMLTAVAALSVIFLLYGALQFITSRGDSERAERARNTISHTIVGIIIAILAYAIVNVVYNLITREI